VTAVVEFWRTHLAELGSLLAQHVALVVTSTLVAVVIGIPLGIVAARRPRIGGPLTALAGIVQAIPSLALFGFLLPLPLVGGIGARTAVTALILYALLPIVRTTAAGLQSIDRAILEAADAMGMSPRQRIVQVELPLALPAIVAGIRVATVVGVGTVTIAAAIGAGGLGEYIYRGLSMVDATVILAGAIPAAGLALAFDALLLVLQRSLERQRRTTFRRSAVVASLCLVMIAGAGVAFALAPRQQRIVVGSKNFTEQVILGEIVAQAISRYAGLPVDRRLNLGGTFICDRALRAGEIDVYVEYSGTALNAVFRQPASRDPAHVIETTRRLYAERGVAVRAPLGFDNTFAILVRGADARALKLTRLSELAAHALKWRAGFGYEFLERKDGYTGLAATYGLRFREPPRVMDLTLIYRALASGQIDVTAGDATAGLIDALDLVALADDRRYFPPYDAVPLVHAATLLRHPELGEALNRLAGRIDAGAMRRMNYAVDGRRRDPADVAREFLDTLR
jgi:osmoprotectant transport system permease protein